jgi:hypothetical protein
MAGGLFGKPFAFNIKCIIFSLLCMALFLYKPTFATNYTLYGTLFIIFTIAYVAMAWYDYFFDCRILPLRKGEFSLQQYLKPPAHQPQKQVQWDGDEDKNSLLVLIYLSHILFIVPLIGYVALYKRKVNPLIYPILGVLSVFTLSYHGIQLITSSHKIKDKKDKKDKEDNKL